VRALIQRVSRASVTVSGETLGAIGPGLMILVCAMQGDDATRAAALARKIALLRILRDDDGKMNRAILDTGGEALVVSQFTLAADTTRGNRPGFSAAADPATGERLYEAFADALASQGVPVQRGRFGADMQVALVNDGPVTVWLEA
jgi:D-aminoacyl-tRNA deacylase